ncbi:MAG: DUF4350 domain-containing protein [Propioniciclava sp.]
MSSPASSSSSQRLGWLALGLAVTVLGLLMAGLTRINTMPPTGLLEPESAGPQGAQAVVQLLRAQGVTVTVVRDRPAVVAALAGGPDTLVLPATEQLSTDTVTELMATASDVVLLNPRADTLKVTFDSGILDTEDSLVEPGCDLPDAQRAGNITLGQVYQPGDASVTCYSVGLGSGLLIREHPSGRIVALDGTQVVTNEYLGQAGNAALALNLMGQQPTLVWYLPGTGDTDVPPEQTLGSETPAWVSPAVVMLLIAAAAAGIWRGRRFGPLVVENLPVMVRVGETTAGRARLYARAHNPTHAADQLRAGTLRRLTRQLALGAAPAPQIADAVASVLGQNRDFVHSVLLNARPRNDHDLVELAGQLRALEDAVGTSLRPERNPR